MSAALAFKINHGEYTKRITGAIRLAFVNERAPVKRIADAADCSLATAKNWWEQRCAPEGLHLMRLGAAVPEVGAEVRCVMGMEMELDPELQRDIVQPHQTGIAHCGIEAEE